MEPLTTPKKQPKPKPIDDYLRENIGQKSQTEIAKEIGRSKSYVSKRIKLLGLVSKPKKEPQPSAQKVLSIRKPKPQNSVPRYLVDDKIRILLGKEGHRCLNTYGVVVEVEPGNIPVIEYRNLSGLRLSDFSRHLTKKEFYMAGTFYVHYEEPGCRIETQPIRELKLEDLIEEVELEDLEYA